MSILTFPYDETYLPAFPVIEIEIDGYHPEKRPQAITALIDSGADGTMIPIDTLQAVGAVYEDRVQLRGVTGGVQTVDRYTVSIKVGEHRVRSVHAVALAASSEPIIGRDLLNELVLRLNGPAHATEIFVAS